ncbi:hypothetical protein GWK47_019497 [Chionoecetes opilio]|uniref:Uncharacterized protein n=1 Tax=Chionoecetes opilio TaxID=41210 RepID=A0A8J5CIT6_CHIOP|nr:hypothetical protein GWK47_019497 [Chionoecetes opilio]
MLGGVSLGDVPELERTSTPLASKGGRCAGQADPRPIFSYSPGMMVKVIPRKTPPQGMEMDLGGEDLPSSRMARVRAGWVMSSRGDKQPGFFRGQVPCHRLPGDDVANPGG